MYLLNVCTSIHAVRFTNLGVLTINTLKVSKCFTFLFAAVPMCFHAAMFHMAVSFTCFFFVTFLNFLSRVHLMYLQGGGRACGTSNYRNPVRKFAKFRFTEPRKWKIPLTAKCWLNVTWEETSNSIKVNKSRYKQCGVTPHF